MMQKLTQSSHSQSRKSERTALLSRIALVAALLAAAGGPAWSLEGFRASTDKPSYNIGDEVQLNLILPEAGTALPVAGLAASIRYAGESQPVTGLAPLSPATLTSGPVRSTGYRRVWLVPADARTGRYEVDLVAREANSGKESWRQPRAASFVVHRKIVRIDRVALDKTFYTSGDPVKCKATINNLTGKALTGLRVEFSDFYFPWIAQSSTREGMDVALLAENLELAPEGQKEVSLETPIAARTVQKPSVYQYAVVVWDRERKTIYDLAFSPLVFIHPPGVEMPKPYPRLYAFPELGAVVPPSSSRAETAGGAIVFDRGHTMFPAGGRARVSFSVRNPHDGPWSGVSINASLRSPGGARLGEQVVAEKVDLPARGSPLAQSTSFDLPAGRDGAFGVTVEVKDPSGQILAANSLTLASNPLPRSILIFCAHQDDETQHGGTIRAAVENGIPIRVVFFTSGDAGSCDQYYQRPCGPAEALNFGAIRMQESRAALGHLGVPQENIYFLGLPDGGSEKIWLDHPEATHPYLSVLLASDHAPYEGLYQPNLPYAREPVVEVAKDLIRKFQPDVIFTGHPDERHVDHRTNNWFVVKALQELVKEGAVSSQVKLLVDQTYGAGPQKAAPYRYEKHIFTVSSDALARLQEATWFYQSQSGDRVVLWQIRSFEALPRQEIHWQVLDWIQHAGWNEKN